MLIVHAREDRESPEHVLQFCPLFREARQDHSHQSTFYSSAPSSEKQDRTTVTRAPSTVLSPLQRSKTGPQSPEHVLQFCPLFKGARQDHSHQSTFYSSAPSSKEQDRTTVTRARSTVLPPLQRNKKAAVAPWNNATRTAVGQHGGPSEDLNLRPNHRTDHLRQDHARTKEEDR